MNTGKLDRRLAFQEPTYTQGNDGQKVPTYANISTSPEMWCNVSTPMGARGSNEDFEADQLTAVNLQIFKVRYRDDITEAMRIVYEGDNFDILTISEGERRREFLIIKAEKKD